MLPSSLIPDTEQFEQAMLGLLTRRPAYFDISTFGVPSLRAISRLLGYTTLRVLVGLPAGLTKDQAWGYDELRKIYKANRVTFRYANQHHAKLYVAEYLDHDEVIIGSRNISDSGWREVGVLFSDPNKVCRKLFIQWWNGAFASADKCRKQG